MKMKAVREVARNVLAEVTSASPMEVAGLALVGGSLGWAFTAAFGGIAGLVVLVVLWTVQAAMWLRGDLSGGGPA